MSTRRQSKDHERFVWALPGRPRRVHRRGKIIEVWTCPSCGEKDALTLAHPEWLDYPKPVCWNCPDVEVYQAVGMGELAFRGGSPPLVYCYIVQRYFRIKQRWPSLGQRKGEFVGGCRKCDGCRMWMARYQAHVKAPVWAATVLGSVHGSVGAAVWSIEVEVEERRRVVDTLKYAARKRGGAVGAIPVPAGWFVVASFVRHPDDRTAPIIQRLGQEGHHHAVPGDEQSEALVPQSLESAILDAFLRRRWKENGHSPKIALSTY